MIIDTHAHLYWDTISWDIDRVIRDFKDIGGAGIINIACDLETYGQCIDIQKKYPSFCRSTIGIHPTSAHEMNEEKLLSELEQIEIILEENLHNIVAIGEIWFDHYWLSSDASTKRRQLRLQHIAFHHQTKLAIKYKLPVIIHTRSCTEHTLKEIELSWLQKFVVHCFWEDETVLEDIFELSEESYISVTGTITYPKNSASRDAIAKHWLTRVMIETDTPFLPPQIYRSRVDYNEPKYLPQIIQVLSDVTGVPYAIVEDSMYQNARQFFSL